MSEDKGVGKCQQDHPGSYGYPTRPEEPYAYCPICGNAVVWRCPKCGEPLPDDSGELATARFCRDCGAAYFPDAELPKGEAPAADEAPG